MGSESGFGGLGCAFGGLGSGFALVLRFEVDDDDDDDVMEDEKRD